MKVGFGYNPSVALYSNFNAFALGKITDEELIRLKTEKRFKAAFQQANCIGEATLSKKQIKEQLKSIAVTPIDMLKKMLPDSNESSFRLTIKDFCSVLFKRFKNFVLGLPHHY